MSKIKKFLSVALVFITCLISLASVVKNTYASNIENNVSSSYSYSNAVVEDNGVSYTLYYNSIGRTEAAIAYNSGGENTVINIPDKFTSANASGSTSTTTITAIYESGFANCTATQINLPNTIKQIGKQAFLSCTNLVTFVIPSKVTVIDVATFMNCTALTDVSYMNNDGDSVKVNNTITAINENAFTGCRRLSSFTMPNTLTYIGRSAFKGCVYLTRVILPSASNELEVDDYAFANCNLMIMAYVPNNIKRFGEYVFNGNEKLTIYLSRSTNPSTNDGYTSTWNKTYVSTGNNSYIPYKLNYGRVDLTPTNNFIYSIATKPIMDNFEVHTLDANKDNSEYAVLVSYLGSMDSSEDEVNNGVLTIPEYVVDLEGNKYPVKVIEEGCFSATATNKTGTNLKKVSLPEQLVKIGRKAFFDTTNLADIDFSRCTQLKEISTDDLRECAVVHDRKQAITILENINRIFEDYLSKAGLEEIEDYHQYFEISIGRDGTPEHLFTKTEIETLMRNADDRHHNRLVIDGNGYARIISDEERAYLYPVYIEEWNAGNNYVGKYSKLYALDDSYKYCLYGWYRYLITGRGQFIDYLPERVDEAELIEQIKEV